MAEHQDKEQLAILREAYLECNGQWAKSEFVMHTLWCNINRTQTIQTVEFLGVNYYKNRMDVHCTVKYESQIASHVWPVCLVSWGFGYILVLGLDRGGDWRGHSSLSILQGSGRVIWWKLQKEKTQIPPQQEEERQKGKEGQEESKAFIFIKLFGW